MRAREAASSARAAALASPSATSSANSSMRASESDASGASRVVETTMAPQSSPPTRIGAATDASTPRFRITAANSPATFE
jgi:hypothetical protein